MMTRTTVLAALTALMLLGGGARAADHSDAWITTKVKSTLAAHKDVSAVHTKVRTTGGVVTLSGKAGTMAEKELAERYARGIDGVADVHNRIVVMPARTGHEDRRGAGSRMLDNIDDSSITGRVKAALAGDRATSALSTSVETNDGAVTLTGTAASDAEKTLAERLARDVKGVKSVDNRIEVK
jgi:osmotically-inducible protein OsmY